MGCSSLSPFTEHRNNGADVRSGFRKILQRSMWGEDNGQPTTQRKGDGNPSNKAYSYPRSQRAFFSRHRRMSTEAPPADPLKTAEAEAAASGEPEKVSWAMALCESRHWNETPTYFSCIAEEAVSVRLSEIRVGATSSCETEFWN